MDYQLEVITLSVSDVDQAAAFYTQVGFILDVDGPDRRDYADFADPDGNTWTLQEIGRSSDSSTPVAHVSTE
ncbi:hypothetical protein N4G69_44335 [Streptomyces mirabilis]|uniref:VOC family protein n=1 Tax=Streptomyces mirabilis TaxID=68239 RepID=UPI0021BF106F|nr:hypothetical protein [Streptomyces mirabilis]MCT9112525.1 hypothetical protein [Streptomyces mirabilis]